MLEIVENVRLRAEIRLGNVKIGKNRPCASLSYFTPLVEICTLHTASCLGILDLENGLPAGAPLPPPRPGSLKSSATFGLPVILETVEGAWAEIAMRGDPALKPAYIAAAQRLVQKGAVVISSNCGFAIRYQAAVAAAVNLPVVMSSLLLVPALLRQLSPAGKLAVITSDSRKFGEDLLGIGDRAERARIVVGGIEGGKFWRNANMRPPAPTEVADVEEDVAACVARLRAANPEIAALLFTCTGFSVVTPALRRMTGLPIYDITTLCRAALQSVAH